MTDDNDKSVDFASELERKNTTTKTAIRPHGLSIIFRFARKYWLALLIIIATISAIVVVFYSIPVISISQTKIVNLGAPVTLKVGDIVYLKGKSVSVTVEHFTVDTCPVKGQCFGSNVSAVEYMLTIDGVKYATGSSVSAVNVKYQIQTISSDYKTYVTLRIVKN